MSVMRRWIPARCNRTSYALWDGSQFAVGVCGQGPMTMHTGEPRFVRAPSE